MTFYYEECLGYNEDSPSNLANAHLQGTLDIVGTSLCFCSFSLLRSETIEDICGFDAMRHHAPLRLSTALVSCDTSTPLSTSSKSPL